MKDKKNVMSFNNFVETLKQNETADSKIAAYELRTLPSLPYELVNRTITYKELDTVFTASGWDSTSRKGSHLNYAPPIDDFVGAIALVIRCG